MTYPGKISAATRIKEDYVDDLIAQWKAEKPELDTSALHIFGRLHRLYLMYNHAISDTFEQYGINAAGFDVLSTLKRSGGDYTLTPTQLAEFSLVTSGGISLRLNRLEDAGLVERIREKSDRRSVHVRLTQAGQDLVSEVAEVHFAREKEMMAGLSPEEAEELTELLRKLGMSVKTYLWGADPEN
ncbi:MarR family winged helix-turn-helix transcriptional regulator [Corynebacterium halotolerans]|uniref:MarR family winged helix-turn-helix transcriptional regulator n=1 Tax=Corynebacterium halotolerans TaxID=225326 RepID=UPI003CF18A5D